MEQSPSTWLTVPTSIDTSTNRRVDYNEKREASRNGDPTFYQKLADAKRQTPLT